MLERNHPARPPLACENGKDSRKAAQATQEKWDAFWRAKEKPDTSRSPPQSALMEGDAPRRRVPRRSDGLEVTLAHVDLALELCRCHRLGYYNALIVAASRLARCRVLFSEDLSHGHDYEGVRIENQL